MTHSVRCFFNLMFGTNDLIVISTKMKYYMRVILLFLRNLHCILAITALSSCTKLEYNNGFIQKFIRHSPLYIHQNLIYDSNIER